MGGEMAKGSKNKNFYLIKPEGVADVEWGYQQGRWVGQNVQSSSGHQAKSYWFRSQCDSMVLDPMRSVLIELDTAYRNDNA